MKLPLQEPRRGPRAAALALLCLGGASAAQLRRGTPAALVESDGGADGEASVAPMLLDFTKDLKAGVGAAAENAEAVVRWCKAARGTKASMLSVLQRQLDEAAIALKQVALEERRLASEARLASGTLQAQQQRLADASASGEAATAVFGAEAGRLDKALRVASRAEELLSQRQSQDAEVTSDDNSEDAPARDEVGSELEFSQGQQMLQKLRAMQTKLTQERSVESSEHSIALQKMAAFQDHLNASLMDSASQVAAIGAEASRRKREGARLRARRAGLEALLEAARASSKATDEVCSEEELHRGELGEVVSGEKQAVSALLGSLRTTEASDDAPALIQLSSEETAAGAAALRHAVDELRGIARRFPGAATALQESAKRRGLPLDAQVEGSPLENVQAFIRADHHGGSAADSARRYIRELYTGLVADFRNKAAAFATQRGQCTALARDGSVDEAALSRSYKTVEARLHMAKAAVAEYERSATFFEGRRAALAEQLEALRGLAAQASGLAATEGARLQSFAQRLIGQSDLEEQAARTAQGLAQEVEAHRGQLQRRAQRLQRQAAAVAKADGPLMTFLAEEGRHAQRLRSRAAAESELLESRAAAKAEDQKLGEHFVNMISKLCTPKKLKALADHSEELQRIGSELRSLAAGDRHLAATASDELGEAELAALLK